MKRFIIILLMTTVCGTSMAGISSESFESWYDDLLEFFRLYRDRDEVYEKIDAYNENMDSYNPEDEQDFTPSTDINLDPASGDLPLPEQPALPGTAIDTGQGVIENPDSSIISNPEPCSIIMSSIGLGIVGYLKRRRAI